MWSSFTNNNRKKFLLKCVETTRLTIISKLVEHGKLTPSQMIEYFDISKPALSQHLRVLENAGLVTIKKDGYYRLYSINEKKLTELNDLIQTHINVNNLSFSSDYK